MLDFGTTFHMTPFAGCVKNKKSYNVPIGVADYSTIIADRIGLRVVNWNSDNGVTEVTLADTLVAPDAAVSILPVPMLVRKGH